MIVWESLLFQHGFGEKESNYVKAFSVVENDDPENPMKEAFQPSVRNGNPDEPHDQFTSLFHLMTKPLSLKLDTDTFFI